MTTTLLLLATLLAQGDKEASKAADEAIKQFKASYSPRATTAERAAAVKILSGTKHSKVLSKLAGLCQGDVEEVRIEAAIGLGSYTDEKLKRKASGVLYSAIGRNMSMPTVCKVIFESIGRLGVPQYIAMLPRFFEHKDDNVAEGAILGAGEGKNRISVDPLLKLMEEVAPAKDKGKDVNNLTGTNQGGGRVNVGGGGGGGLGGFGLPGGVGGGGNNKKANRDKKLYSATITAMQTISGEKWTTYKEWVIWWKRNVNTFQVKAKK